MKKDEIRKLMSENFEEITIDEWNDLNHIGESCVHCEEGDIHFKPKQKLPVVFEDEFYKIEVGKDLIIIINDKQRLSFCDSLPMLEKAIDKYRELKE